MKTEPVQQRAPADARQSLQFAMTRETVKDERITRILLARTQGELNRVMDDFYGLVRAAYAELRPDYLFRAALQWGEYSCALERLPSGDRYLPVRRILECAAEKELAVSCQDAA
jgi:hypothetical protein